MSPTLFSALLAVSLAAPLGRSTTAPTPTASAPAVPTHTLTMQRAPDGCLFVDGISQTGVVTIDLEDCNVGARGREGGKFSTVTLPDGRVYYKGDFVLRVQSLADGLREVEVCHGEAVVSPRDLAPFSAAAQPKAKPAASGSDGPA